MGVNRVPFVVIVKKIEFHEEDSKVGDETGMFDIHYKLRNFDKGQVLANFVAEFTPPLLGSMGIC